MWARSELTVHLLTRIARDTEATAREQRRASSELMRIRREITALAFWLQRVALLVALYGGGLLLFVLSEEKVELLVRAVKAWKAG